MAVPWSKIYCRLCSSAPSRQLTTQLFSNTTFPIFCLWSAGLFLPTLTWPDDIGQFGPGKARRSMKGWWECFDKLQQEKEEAAESKHAPCQRAWPRCGDQSIDRGKNKVRRSGKNPGKKSSYRSPLNSRNIRQEGGVMQTHNRLFVVTCTLRAFCSPQEW